MLRYCTKILLVGLLFPLQLIHAQPDIASSSSPSDGDSDVSLRLSQIVIDFEADIQEPGDSPVTIQPTVGYTPNWAANNADQLTLTLTEFLEPETTYTVTLNSIADAATGNTSNASFTFTTGAATSISSLSLTESLCVGSEAVLNDIVIEEGAIGNFFDPGGAEGARQNIELQLPPGFTFNIDNASIALDNSPADISLTTTGGNQSLEIYDGGRELLIGFQRGNVSGAANEDVIRISDLKIVAPESASIGNFSINLTQVDASFPGLTTGALDGTLAVTEGLDFTIVEGDQAVSTNDQNPTVFCENSDITLTLLQDSNREAVPAGSEIFYFVEGEPVADTDFVIGNGTITINKTTADAFLAKDGVNGDYPLSVSAEITSGTNGNGCLGYSNRVFIDVYDPAGIAVVLSTEQEIINGDKKVPGSGALFKINGNPLRGNLTITVDAGTDNEEVISFTGYNSDSDPYFLNIDSLASNSRNVKVDLLYTGQTERGCYINTDDLSFEIQKIPQSKQELDINPTYCTGENDLINIEFAPGDAADSVAIDSLVISGQGITGATSLVWDPQMGTDSTGYTFSVEEARNIAESNGVDTVAISLSYKEEYKRYIFGRVCEVVVETYQVEICEDQFGCVPCQPGECFEICDPNDFRSDCYIEECPIGDAFCDIRRQRKIAQQKDSVQHLRNLRQSNQIINNPNCGDCGFNRICKKIGEDCRFETRTREVTVCTDGELIDSVTVRNVIAKEYVIRFLDVPELSFTTATREPLNADTVFCEQGGTVYLLGTPGNTFDGKSYSISDGNTLRSVANYSFSLDSGFLTAREEPYTLFYNYNPSDGCSAVDSMSFRIVPVPDSIVFPVALPRIDSIASIEYCLGSAIDSVRMPIEEEIEYIWRDERGSLLHEGNSFLPRVDATDEGLTRFRVEKRHANGGCSGPSTDFYIKIGEAPTSNFTFTGNCGSQASFTTDAIHDESIAENDTISNYNWNFGDVSQVTVASSQENIVFNFPAPGVYDVDLSVETSIGCSDIITKKVTVFDEAEYRFDNNTYTYAQDFTSGSEGWISTADNNNAAPEARNSSWSIREVEGLTAWHAYNEQDSTYNDNEFSWVQSPYFNLSNWNSPKLQMDILFDTPELEGAVLQYQIKDCNATDASETWVPVGTVNGGLAWYNNASISAGPGGSITGWSGVSKNNSVGANTSDSWQTVAYDLAGVRAVAGNELVQFRIAFASLSLGANREAGRRGFAFTNFTISEKSRKSLVENFTHISRTDGLRQSVSDFANEREDAIYIEYHTGRPAGDPLYYGYHFSENTSNDGETRAFVYGLDGPGYTIVNGRFQSFDPFTRGWGEQQYSQETLLSPAFDLSLDYTYQEGEPLKVKAMAVRNDNIVTLIDTAQAPQLMSLKVAVVERAVTEYTSDTLRNVFVKYLGQYPGAFAEKDWKAGSNNALTLEEEWQIPVKAKSGRFSLIAWIELAKGSPETGPNGQAFNNVFQAMERVISTDLTAVPILLSNTKSLAGDWSVYPVPARDYLQVQCSESIGTAIDWQLVSSKGSVLKKGKYSGGSSNFEVNLEGLNAGMYVIQMNSEEGQMQMKFMKR